MNVVEFAKQHIPNNEKGKPWTWSDYQRDVLTLAFERDYSIRLWSEPKKSGKTFLAAVIAIWEAVTNADSEVVCLANDEEQAVSRVFATVVALIKYNPELSASAKVLTSEIRFTNGSIIRAASSDYKGEAGGRQKLTIYDEIWAFEHERMTRLFEETTPPPTEQGAYILIVSYAGFTGEGELLENLYKRGLKGKRVSRSLECYRDAGLFMFWSHKPRQAWQLGVEGRAYYAEQRRILRPNTFARLHRNEWVSAESQFIDGAQWDACVDPMRSPALGGKSVHLAIDLGVKSDTSAVVGVGWENQKIAVAFHRVWRPTKNQPVPLNDVKEFIVDVCRRHSVQKILADPSQAYLLIQQLAQAGITVEEFPQTVSNTTKMGETLFSLVKDGNLIAYKSPELREHVLNAVGIETPSGVRMVKNKSSKKIDAAIALAMACVSAAGRPALDISGIRLFGSTRISRNLGWESQGEYSGSGLSPLEEAWDSGALSRRFWDS